jgi:outer membrane lipoprotein-sorting protein
MSLRRCLLAALAQALLCLFFSGCSDNSKAIRPTTEVENTRLEAEKQSQDEASRVRAKAGDFEQVISNPSAHVGQTYTFRVWLWPSKSKPATEKDVDGNLVVDGYIIWLADGSGTLKEALDSDKVVRGGFYLDKLIPVLDSDSGRKLLKDVDKDTVFRWKITFTVEKRTYKFVMNTDRNYYIARIHPDNLSVESQITPIIDKAIDDTFKKTR